MSRMRAALAATVLILALFGPACMMQEKAGSKINLSWKAVSGDQQGFKIEQSDDGKTFDEVQNVPDGTTTATIVSVVPGKTYTFRVRGYNAAGTSPYSQTVSVTVPKVGH